MNDFNPLFTKPEAGRVGIRGLIGGVESRGRGVRKAVTTMEENELLMPYPIDWESEYKLSGTVAHWRQDFPHLFETGSLSTRLGTLDLFAQYALQYLLGKREGVESLTWYKLASRSPQAKNWERTHAHWKTMRHWMGDDTFTQLQQAVIAAGFKDFDGEPDLFCWNPQNGHWFFAEAKRRDRLGKKQRNWFTVCREVLGERADIRVYRLIPERQNSGLGVPPVTSKAPSCQG